MLNAHILLVKHAKTEEPAAARAAPADPRPQHRGVVPYAIATVLAVISSYVTLAICGALALFYAFPIASGGSD